MLYVESCIPSHLTDQDSLRAMDIPGYACEDQTDEHVLKGFFQSLITTYLQYVTQY